MARDRIYSFPLDRVGDFAFDEQVVSVFPDMISRSVPGYASILAMTAELAARYARPQTTIYDLGCSLGAATLAIQSRVATSCQIHAVDSSPAMLRELDRTLAQEPHDRASVHTHCTDICELEFEPSSFVVLNFTLQFVPLANRHPLLRAVFESLRPGGALVLSEKIEFEDPTLNQLMMDLHHDFKRANGYSDLEIAQKRTALERTLLTETAEAHLQRLRDTGFRTACMWFQCFNFASILAVK